ncbi:hypothetical protein VNO77_14577 [Canavalia gladiata]|uniref:Uncharacterized protein n=1 Tax=Canavalia gladiata TaxID=3824 RepID=A0AAN9QQU8_CANGL
MVVEELVGALIDKAMEINIFSRITVGELGCIKLLHPLYSVVSLAHLISCLRIYLRRLTLVSVLPFLSDPGKLTFENNLTTGKG